MCTMYQLIGISEQYYSNDDHPLEHTSVTVHQIVRKV